MIFSPTPLPLSVAPVFRQLCHVFGFGRSEGLRGTKSWRGHFEEVVGHFEMCEQYGCKHYGVVGESLLARIPWAAPLLNRVS
jgi:hypothetical protein